VLEGVVTNVTAFGAFLYVGVHQYGMVHVSQMSDRFEKDPSEVVKVGERVSVRVLEVDLVRRRIALTRKSGAVAPASDKAQDPRQAGRPNPTAQRGKPAAAKPQAQKAPAADGFRNNPFASHFKR
jgi:uncharacterized protein